MTLWRLLLRNLCYHWRANFAVLCGVVVGTSVLTGALLVGDSLRGSLHDLALRRLGWVDESMVAPRFFRAELAKEIKAGRTCPAILVSATVVAPATEGQPERTARHVTVVGVDARFWDGFHTGNTYSMSLISKKAINSTLAGALDITSPQKISLRMQRPSAIPAETPLGRRDSENLIVNSDLEIHTILKEGEPGDAFQLKPELEAPRLVFLPLHELQERLGVKDRVNTLLVKGGEDLASQLKNKLTLADWDLTLDTPESRVADLFDRLDRNKDGKLQRREWVDHIAESVARHIAPDGELTRQAVEAFYRKERNYLSLQSRHIVLEPPVADAALAAAQQTGFRAAPTLIYLANTIRSGTEEIPYSVVAALPPGEPVPLGPFLPAGVKSLADDEIVLADWEQSPLRDLKPGAPVELFYYEPEQHAEPHELKASFHFAGRVPLAGVSGDPDLTPEFPGITDKLKLREWDPPFPYDNKRVKPHDDHYWREFRTTPKAYVTLAAGQRLWGSRFGNLTSVRLAADMDAQKAAQVYERALLQNLAPDKGGFAFQSVKSDALKASAGGTDFSGLFVGFSFFLIAAALLLVGLLFRLNLDRRAPELGMLLAVGYRPGTVRRLLLGEGAVIAALGTVAGMVMALAYAWLLVRFLGAIWPGSQLSSLLQPHASPTSLVIGAVGSLLVSLATIAWAVRVLGKVAVPALLRGQTTMPEAAGPTRARWSFRILIGCLLGACGLQAMAFLVKDHEAQAGAFFGSGSLLLTAALAWLWAWLCSSRHRPVERGGWGGVARLGVRNAARHPTRSLLTAGLLASAAFLLVVVEAFRRHADVAATDIKSGSGGFALLGESDLPIFADLNNEAGRNELATALLIHYREALGGDNAAAQERLRQALALLQQCVVFPFRVRAGDDASCLNLYQPRQPKLLGVPGTLVDRDGFQFAATHARTAEERDDPWLVLRRDGEEVPALGENNTVVWMLHKNLGETVAVTDGKGTGRSLRIDGLLSDSIFQSGLLISDKRFLQLYPNQEGFTFFLVQTPDGMERAVKEVLDLALAAKGFEATPTAERLNAYLAVENTYLSTFQALGGLGLILGSLGLAVVLLRGLWERRAELALLRALGWRRRMLGWLILAENGFLLLVGLSAGTLAALLAIAPQAAQIAAPPWERLGVLLAVVLTVGIGTATLALVSSLRAPIVPALRRE